MFNKFGSRITVQLRKLLSYALGPCKGLNEIMMQIFYELDLNRKGLITFSAEILDQFYNSKAHIYEEIKCILTGSTVSTA